MDFEKSISDVPITLSFAGNRFVFAHPDDNCTGYVDLVAHITTPDGNDWWIEDISAQLHGSSTIPGRREQTQLTEDLIKEAEAWIKAHHREEIDRYVEERWRDFEPSYDKYRHEAA